MDLEGVGFGVEDVGFVRVEGSALRFEDKV